MHSMLAYMLIHTETYTYTHVLTHTHIGRCIVAGTQPQHVIVHAIKRVGKVPSKALR